MSDNFENNYFKSMNQSTEPEKTTEPEPLKENVQDIQETAVEKEQTLDNGNDNSQTVSETSHDAVTESEKTPDIESTVGNNQEHTVPQPEQQSAQTQMPPNYQRGYYQPPTAPSQQYSQQYNGYNPPVYNQQPYTNQPYYNVPTPPQPQKNKKGLKFFIAGIAIVFIFACFAIGVSLIRDGKNSVDKTQTTTDAVVNENVPEITNNSTPEYSASSGKILSGVEIAEKVKPCVVGVVVYTSHSNNSAGEGSGIVISRDDNGEYTYIATCAHVIDMEGLNVKIQTENGESYDAEIVGLDTRTDIGVLRVRTNKLLVAELGNSDALKVGEPIYAIGNPGGVEFAGSFTGGFVSAIDRPVSSEIGYTMKCIQHDAAINPGNSGGALINSYGQVIGINSLKITAADYEGMGFAIPISSALEIINSLMKHGYVPNRPKLGITYYSVTASATYSWIAQINGLPAGTLIINEISNDSSLYGTEARQYDMIIAVDGKKLTTADVLLEKIDNGKVGDTFTLTLCRVNNDYTITKFDVDVTLVEDKGTPQTTTTTSPQVNPFEDFYGFGY